MHSLLRSSKVLALLFCSVIVVGCSSGRGSLLALEDEKAAVRAVIAKKIGATPLEVEQALDTTVESQERSAAMVTQRVVQRVGTSDDKAMQAHLQNMANRLAKSIGAEKYYFKVVLLESNQVNAFTPGAGQILINEGLLQFSRSEGQVAAVMAHEMAHVLLRHPQRQKQIRLASKAGGRFMDAFTPDRLRDNLGQMLRHSGNATMNGMMRQQELMADSISIDILAKAGYEPRELVTFLQNLNSLAPQVNRLQNVVNGNHPLTEDRVLAAAQKIELNYPTTRGLVSSQRFETLVRPYHIKRLKRLAQKN